MECNVLKFHPCCSLCQNSLSFKAEYYSTVWIDHILFVRSSVHGCLGCFHLLAILNTGVQISA